MHWDDDEDEGRGSWRALFRFLRMHWDNEQSTERSADSLVRESLKFGSRGHGCPRSLQWFMERISDAPRRAHLMPNKLFIKRRIMAAARQQVSVGAALNNFAAAQHQDLMGVAHRGQAVRD